MCLFIVLKYPSNGLLNPATSQSSQFKLPFSLNTFGALGGDPKTIEMRIPQENKEECLKAAKTFKFTLPVISVDTRCEPRMDNEEPEVRGVRT